MLLTSHTCLLFNPQAVDEGERKAIWEADREAESQQPHHPLRLRKHRRLTPHGGRLPAQSLETDLQQH